MDDDEIKKEMLSAMEGAHPEDQAPTTDPFATDADGKTPEKIDDMGGDDSASE